ncbi:hypothetical protein Tco_1130986 [Tanacetum coccineum]
MANLPPPNNDPNVPKEEPILGQAPAAPVGFGQLRVGGQIPNNNNGWLEEDLEKEDPGEDLEEGNDKEEEMEVDDEEDPEEGDDEEEEMEVDDEENNSEVFPPGPRPSDLRAINSRTTKLEKQMFESRGKRLSEWEAQVRPQIPEGLRFREEPPILSASVPCVDDPYVMIRDAARAAQEDADDDVDADKDPQPSEFCGPPRDP